MNIDRRVVCAALAYKDILILGARHFDHTMINQISSNDKAPFVAGKAWEQGFINTWGEFLTREEAWIVAEHNNQIIKRVGGDDKKLFSENLY